MKVQRPRNENWVHMRPAWLVAVRKGCLSFILTKRLCGLALEGYKLFVFFGEGTVYGTVAKHNSMHVFCCALSDSEYVPDYLVSIYG